MHLRKLCNASGVHLEKIEEEEDTVDVWRYHPMDLSCHLFFQTTLTLKAECFDHGWSATRMLVKSTGQDLAEKPDLRACSTDRRNGFSKGQVLMYMIIYIYILI